MTGFLCNNAALKDRRGDLRKNQTDVEKMLWGKLRNRQLSGIKFFRQYSLGSYILDFYSPKLKLAIELDGGQHAEQDSMEYDEVRSEYLRSQGVDVMRFWNNEVIDSFILLLNRPLRIPRNLPQMPIRVLEIP